MSVNWRRISWRIFAGIAAAAALALAGCAANPATGGHSLTGFSTTQKESQAGADENPQVLAAFGGAYNDPALASYVNEIGQRVAAKSERQGIIYTFQILNTPIVNALAIPGGYIYVTRGLLALMNNEAELACVLAHEVGHVAAMHHAQGSVRNTIAQVSMLPLAVVAPILLGLPQMAATGFLRASSREAELEADKLGIRYVARAGYDPAAMASFLTTMRSNDQLQALIDGRSAGSVDQFDYRATHPGALERYRQTLAEASLQKVSNPIVRRSEYLARIGGMLYGESPEQGFIRGRAFEHPILRLRFEVAPGFELFDTPKYVYASGPCGSMIVFDSAPEKSGLAMTAYIRKVWAKGVELKEVRSGKVNGLEAATAIATLNTRKGKITMRAVAIRAEAACIYRFRFIAPADQAEKLAPAFAQTISSFKLLSASEAAALKPRRIKSVSATKKDTVKSLAARCEFDKYRAEHFRVLNGIAPDTDTISTRQVKLVVY